MNLDKRLISLSSKDNVLVCCRQIPMNEAVEINGTSVTMPLTINVGHKIARQAIAEGELIVRCGMPIGSATSPIALGAHVHSHNIKSDYTASHDRNATQSEQ
ncbi:MAG: UxaA family hydrolase [Sinobacterium sp.]|jgi:hypothetical protein|tara:strand:- start:1196 stop:1501 length:306 start_codon:yes stop_codon:yes gene_type:complete